MKNINKIVAISLGCLITAALLVFVFIALFYKLQVYTINGPSMLPVFTNGEKIMVEHRIPKLKRGDVVIFNSSLNGQIIKRVVAFGGERVVIDKGKLTVYNSVHPNGFDPDTTYGLSVTSTSGNVNLVIPAGKIYTLGDNRSDSYDSREFGPVSISSIVGKYLFKE
jgi:signal peptidase I